MLLRGKVSLRDEKEPQIMVDQAAALDTVTEESFRTYDRGYQKKAPPVPRVAQDQPKTLYLKLPSQNCREFTKLRPILQMFPGNTKVVIFLADTRQRMGTVCLLDDLMLQELRELLGEENVVLK